MVFLQIFYDAAVFFLLARMAEADVRSLRIPAWENCLMAACSLVRVTGSPAEWAESLAAACLFAGLLFSADLLLSSRERGSDRFPLGGGDIRLVFSLLLQFGSRKIPLWGGTACLYVLLTWAVWPEKRRMPLGPALAGAGAVCMLSELGKTVSGF